MNSIIEQQRILHEEAELCEEELVKQLAIDMDKKTKKEQVYHSHLCAQLLDDIQTRHVQLDKIYNDMDGTRAKEIESISKPNDFNEFYKRFKGIQQYYRHDYVIENPVSIGYGDNHPTIMKAISTFTDEEGYGRFLDLHEQHDAYINFVKSNKIMEQDDSNLGYLQYIGRYSDFREIPLDKKKTNNYKKYIGSLKTYLHDYYLRCNPLEPEKKIEEEFNEKFQDPWNAGEIPGWEIDEEAEKENSTKLFCVPCKKQFTNAAVYKGHLPGKKHKKNQERLTKSGVSEIDVSAEKERVGQVNRDKDKAIAEVEFFVIFMSEKLKEQREATKMNVERKQARSSAEWQEESDDPDLSEDDVDMEDETNAALYNPKNLPLDWDGKRIPYWLFKLHGLSKYYSCEICDGVEYRGPKAFAKHFQEAKHSAGMKLLGIPNTIHFQNVTSKGDAKKLWEKLKADKQKGIFRADQEEEYEDSLGNVVSKRIYEDLKNNNLL